MSRVGGHVEPGFEAVRQVFAHDLDQRVDAGAAVTIHVEGRRVVDLWGGVADGASGRAYDGDTLQLVLSATKGAVAVCANLLVERGQLDLDQPVADHWPEFAQQGKHAIPTRWLLSHRAGVPVVDAPLDLDAVLAWDPVAEALAAQVPQWAPGTAHGYHAMTFGWLVGELIRRVDGRSVGEMVQAELADRLGLDLWIGLPADEDHRVAPLVPSPPPTDPAELAALRAAFGPGTPAGRALSLNGLFPPPVYNRRDVRAAEIPAANGVTNARSLSRLYAALVGPLDGRAGPLLGPAQLEAAHTAQTDGDDRVLSAAGPRVTTVFGLGFMLGHPGHDPFGVDGAFGHPGAGGSLGFADPEAQLAFGYTTNQMGPARLGAAADPRTERLVRAAYTAIGSPDRLTVVPSGARRG